MGLQCSILGHAFEDAGVEREREEQGSEVITTEREIERCRRCGTERVVSESTEVAAVVDASDVEGVAADRNDADRGGFDPTPENESDSDSSGSGLAGAIDRSGAGGSGTESASESPASDAGGMDATPPGDTSATPDPGASPGGSFDRDDPGATEADEPLDATEADDPPDPTEEDAEILTDDDDIERAPGQWPDETDPDADADSDEAVPTVETSGDGDSIAPAEEPLSGITVPDGEIVCPECTFRIEADSGYRAGDPCPECNAWLEAERNQ